MFGSVCATALGGLCVAYAFAGCLNPSTDDQPSFRDNESEPAVTSPLPGSSSSDPGAGGELTPGDGFVDQPGGPSDPASSPPPSANAGDAGTTELDAGPDSGSLESLP
jgi:hypothetical protein